jgi:hypothetical protein
VQDHFFRKGGFFHLLQGERLGINRDPGDRACSHCGTSNAAGQSNRSQRGESLRQWHC